MSQQARLKIVLALNVSMIAGLIIVGLSSHSLGVLAAGGDYMADSSAIGLGMLAIYLRDRAKGKSKATSIVALINSLLLLGGTMYVIFEAIRRLTTQHPEVHGLPVLIVSAIATGVMIIGALVLGSEDDEDDLHMRSVLLDTISDAVTSAAVAVTGAVIYFARGLYWLDSAVALAVGVFIGYQALRLLRDVVTALRK